MKIKYFINVFFKIIIIYIEKVCNLNDLFVS